MKKYILIIILFCIRIHFASGQDIIELKSGNKIETRIIQIDKINIYYYKWNDKNSNIISISNSDVSQIIFENVDYSNLNNGVVLIEYKNKTYEIRNNIVYNNKSDTLKKPRQKYLSLNLNLFPLIDYSLSFYPNKHFSVEIGKGPKYYFIGTRIYLRNVNKKWKNYIGIFYCNLEKLNNNNYINIPIGFELQKPKIKLRLELGVFIGSNSTWVLPRMGVGIRF